MVRVGHGCRFQDFSGHEINESHHQFGADSPSLRLQLLFIIGQLFK